MLAGYALERAGELISALHEVVALAPCRNMVTPGGKLMSVAMSNCGRNGWISDGAGYRYGSADPLSGRSWPAMPDAFFEIAAAAAGTAGYLHFEPDACLINRYQPGTRLTLHQDRDERDLTQPIVSVSLGVPATFLWGGLSRTERPQRIRLEHGDVVVWGGPARLSFHGIAPLQDAEHPLTGGLRFNLTFRHVG